jgi:hypothetical protein
MKFLDINLAKDSSLLLHAIHSPFYWRILKKTILFSGYKNPCKKSAKQENSIYSWKHSVERKMSVKNQTNIRVWEDSSLCPETSTKNAAVQEFHLWVCMDLHSIGVLDPDPNWECGSGSGLKPPNTAIHLLEWCRSPTFTHSDDC